MITDEDIEIMNANVNYVSYSRSVSHDYNSIKREMSLTVPEGMEIKKCEDYCRNRVNQLLQRDMYMLEKKKFNMQGYQGD
jgi:hypothetical protein